MRIFQVSELVLLLGALLMLRRGPSKALVDHHVFQRVVQEASMWQIGSWILAIMQQSSKSHGIVKAWVLDH